MNKFAIWSTLMSIHESRPGNGRVVHRQESISAICKCVGWSMLNAWCKIKTSFHLKRKDMAHNTFLP